jgi:hypothetical protein
MAYVGNVSIFEDSGSAGPVFNLININFPGGWPEDEIQRIGEPLTSMGVDGTRARYPRSDYPQFILKGLSEAATYDAAVAVCKDMRKTRIKRATIQIITNGVTYTFGGRKAYIWAIAAKPIRADVVTALGAIAAPLGMVSSEWTLQFIPGT